MCDFIEAYLCHGPGDLLGEPITLSPEQRAFLYRIYEVEPQFVGKQKNPRAGKRRFNRVAISVRKGSIKTEFAALIAAAELHPEGPVRCDGFDASGNPVPKPVTDPYIPMISSTEEQTEELAYGALRRILEQSSISGHFDIGLTRILRLDGHGKAEAVSASPNARDGARTTFQHADETHRFELDNLKKAWTVMLNNLAKRPGADPWALETTTAFNPGARSVAENTHEYAQTLMRSAQPEKSKLFYFHRQASDGYDLEKFAERKKAVIEASGADLAKWSDIDRIAASYDEPDADRAYWERVWLNRPTKTSGIAFDGKVWLSRARDFIAPDGEAITLGFDGRRYEDSAALVATHVNSGHQWPLRIWRHDPSIPDWQVPIDELNGAISDAFSRWYVCRFYADPEHWESHLAQWAGLYDGEKRRVFEWATNRRNPMSYALRGFANAIAGGELSHSNDPELNQHIANARKVDTALRDEEGKPLSLIRKERPGAPIDAAMAAVLSWEARNDAIAAGENQLEPEPEYEMFFL